MKKSTISIIIYIVIFLSILTTSILFDNEIIFFVGLIGIIALYIILNRLEQSKISSFLLSYISYLRMRILLNLKKVLGYL